MDAVFHLFRVQDTRSWLAAHQASCEAGLERSCSQCVHFVGLKPVNLKKNKIKISIKPSEGFGLLSVLWNKCSRFFDGSSLSHVRRVRRVIQHGDALHSQELSRDSGNRGKREIMLPQLRISLCRHSGPNWSEKLIGCIWELWRQQSWNFSSDIFSEKAKKHPSKY